MYSILNLSSGTVSNKYVIVLYLSATSGVFIENLEEEDYHLLQGATLTDSDSDASDFMYHERMRPNVLNEFWDIADEDVDKDFPQGQSKLPSVDVFETSRINGNAKIIVRWMLIFLCLWSSFCSLSDNAFEVLLAFLRAVFDSVGTIFPLVASFAVLFPKSVHLLRKQLGVDQDKFIKYVVCPKCHSLYNFDDCYETLHRRKVSKTCTFVQHPHHRQRFRRTACGEPLLKEVSLKTGETKLYPFKVYCYHSIIDNLKHFLQRPGFEAKCELWRSRDIPEGYLADIFDGRIWKEWQYVYGKPFLAAPRNYAFMLNVDWFQPFKHSLYSVGALYMVLMNLPRSERFKPENVFLVGVIPGPHEPKLNINTYLQPLVGELNALWENGMSIKAHDSTTAQVFHAALLCVGCDVPAARKVCGFTGHASNSGCSKCKKYFPGTVTTKIDFSGFDPWPLRSNHEHRQQAQEILNQTSAGDCSDLEQKYGTRYSELMQLPYFDCVRFHIIDPMHNLFTGTAKHVMRNIWLDSEKPLLEKKDLLQVQEKLDKVKVPATVGRMPKKIRNSYGGFTADQWKSFTVIFSIYALWNILPKDDLELWRDFVLACLYLCSSVITEAKAILAHAHLLKFCKHFEELYGKQRVTPNMHLHTHLLNCVLDYGPVYAFWLFSFERYNGILGDYGTNQRAVEIQLMRKFTSNQFVKDIPLPTVFRDIFQPLLTRLTSKQSGSLQDHLSTEHDCIFAQVIRASCLPIGPLQKGDEWACTDSLYTCCGPSSRDNLDAGDLVHLKRCYGAIFNGIDEDSVTPYFERFAACRFNGDLLGSSKSRSDRSAFILARWCKLGGTIDSSGGDLRPGVIDFFMKQNVNVNGKYVSCILASVHWFQAHPSRHSLGAPVEVWCKELFEPEGDASFIPVKRIYGKFIPALDIVAGENVLVVCPLTRKLQC